MTVMRLWCYRVRTLIVLHSSANQAQSMLSLQVVSQLGRPLAAPISAVFDEQGGAIGRSPDCRLVLPDPNRHISREQARIDQVGADFVVTCLGSANSIFVNGTEVAPGQRIRVSSGDQIVIAEYEIRVVEVADPVAARVASSVAKPAAAEMIPDDFDPFAMPEARAPPPMPAAPASHPLAGRVAVDTYDQSPAAANALDPLGLAAQQSSAGPGVPRPADSIDALFDLKSASADPLGLDSPLSGPLSQPNTAGSVDPLVALNMAPRAAPEAAPDRGSELSGSMRLPEQIPATDFGLDRAPVARSGAPAPAPTRPLSTPSAPTPSAAAPSSDRGEPFLSWRDGDTAQTPAAAATPSVRQPALAPEEVRSIAERAAEAHRGDFEHPPATRPTDFLNALNRAQLDALRAQQPPAVASDSAASVAAPSSDAEFELLKGLLLGLGFAELPRGPMSSAQPPRTLTPELMRRIGEILRVATDGTIDLLQARAVLKREMKTEVTVITTADNNPLKFSPDGQAALAHLLSAKPVRGFMDPVPAMRDAYDDLLAHQVGFVAGMRAAMQGLIARFDPDQLEARLTRKSVLDTMLPMARRARLWELFNEMFADISREAEDDFERLFGREFVRAYEEQIARLGDGRK